MSDGISDPNTTQQVNGSLASAKDSFVSTTRSAMDTIQNHPVTQDVSNTVQNGPVGQAVKDQKVKTTAEFNDLQNSKVVPEQPAATGQPLTQYHSLLYRLLSWRNPRVTALSFASSVAFIFASRYLHVEHLLLKYFTYLLGLSALLEIAGKAALGHGLTTQLRPRKYFVVPRESLTRLLDDVEQLINFVVIEFQRIIFAENVYVTAAAFVASLSSFLLIKLLPFWGLSLVLTSVVYLSPLIYTQNKEFIDGQLNAANDIFNRQAAQVREVTGQYTGKASESVRAYGHQASNQISGLVGQAKDKTGYSNSNLPDAPNTTPFPGVPQQGPTATSDPIISPEPVNAQVNAFAQRAMEAAGMRNVQRRGTFDEEGYFEHDTPPVDDVPERQKDRTESFYESRHTSAESAKNSFIVDNRGIIEKSLTKEHEPASTVEHFHPLSAGDESKGAELDLGEIAHRTGYGDGVVYQSATTAEQVGRADHIQYHPDAWKDKEDLADNQFGRRRTTVF